jgi:hypothetical protein
LHGLELEPVSERFQYSGVYVLVDFSRSEVRGHDYRFSVYVYRATLDILLDVVVVTQDI